MPVDFEEVKCDHTCTDEEFEHAIFAIKRNGVAIKGSNFFLFLIICMHV